MSVSAHMYKSTTDWVLPGYFVFRLAGMEAALTTGLRTGRSVAWADQMIETEHALSSAKDELADALGEIVSAPAMDGLRRELLELRRDVFNLRLPHEETCRTVTSRLPTELGGALAGWVALRRDHEARLRQGSAILDAELAEGREHLRLLAEHPRLRTGILLASPSLDASMSRYLKTAGAKLDKRSRRIERSLLEYVYRTACKTSPFSTLTAVALGHFEPGPGGILTMVGPPDEWISHTRLNLAILARISEAVLADPGMVDDLPVRLTTGLRADHERVRYVRREQIFGDDDEAVTLDTVQESLFYLPGHEILSDVLDVLADAATLRLGELRDRLTTRGKARDEVEAYLAHLLRLGLLVTPSLHVDIHEADPVGGFTQRLRALDRPWADAFAGKLDVVSGAVGRYADAELPERRSLLDSIRTALADDPAPVRAPRTLLYEDVTVGPARITADPAVWERLLTPALQSLCRILPIFDVMLPQRLMLRAFFQARYGTAGRCDDVPAFLHEFQHDFFEHYQSTAMRRLEFDDDNDYVDQPNLLNIPELTALDDARRELIRQMRSRYRGLPPGAEELVLDEDFIDAVAARVPPTGGSLEPRCFFLQIGQDAGGRPLAVLNRAYSGLTLQFSRFGHCLAQGDAGLIDGLRAHLAAICPADAVFAEVKGGYETTNLNLHAPVTPYEIVGPGDLSFRPEHEQVPMDDLFIEDSADGRLKLRSRRLGREVIPVYLGFLLPLALPEMQRLLLTFSYTTMARIDMWGGTDEPLGDASIGGHPRLSHGNLVIQRRLWKTRTDRLPRPAQDRGDADHFLDWVRWHRENGLPRRVFVTASQSAGNGDDPPVLASGKPQFIDFDSHFSLMLLDDIVRTAGERVVFTEMLPDLENLWPYAGGGAYVSELTVEMDGVRGENRD
ncbi:lantibiotic dehydratase [Nonomuraea sp. NPDC048881]|uniref:lantibiotic dehydratase n=1 Tax=Nonomuraea sp. NPDC048881 TaxID=3155030 RepID=UPI0033D537E9